MGVCGEVAGGCGRGAGGGGGAMVAAGRWRVGCNAPDAAAGDGAGGAVSRRLFCRMLGGVILVCMKTREEKRWERMQDILFAESRGDKPARVISQRTLFGIKSHVEQVIDKVVAEDKARCEQHLKD